MSLPNHSESNKQQELSYILIKKEVKKTKELVLILTSS